MKTYFIAILSIFATFTAGANDLAKARISTALYFSPRTADNPAHSDWPEKLTFESLPAQSVAEFKKAIQGEWMAGFHCGGSGVNAAELEAAGVTDGIKNPSVTYNFADNVVTQKLSPGAASSKVEGETTQSGRFEIQPLGNNQFKLIFPDHIANVPAIFEFKRVTETGTIVLDVIDENPVDNNGRCSNGEFIEGILSPTQGS